MTAPIALTPAEQLVTACADGTATVEDVMQWRNAILDAEPDVFRRARELSADPYLFRRALDLARDVLAMLDASAPGTASRSGGVS